MLINEKPDYFLVNHAQSQKQSKTLFISNYFPDHINQWSAQTRFSPCFRITDSLLNNGDFHLSKNDFYFLFIGPLPLNKINNSLLRDTCIWLTYGMYNLIIATSDQTQFVALRSFLEQKKYRYEYWTVSDSIIGQYECFTPALAAPVKLSDTILKKYEKDKVMFMAIRGYFTHIMTACERLRFLHKEAYEKMILFHQAVEENILDNIGMGGVKKRNTNFHYISSLNACLTRFNSQSVMGFSPLLEQDISVCGHSLLGVGLASLGVNNIGDYFFYKVGEQYISARFVKLLNKKYEKNVVLTSIPSDNDILKQDYLAEIPIDFLDESEKQMNPLLVFFSSRDNFRKQYNTLSIPLIALYGCNTPGWSLKTMSHEASHILVDGMLHYLLRNSGDSVWRKKLGKLCCTKSLSATNDTFENAIWQLIGIGATDLEAAKNDSEDASFDYFNIFDTYQDEMLEIMTHAFDFLYFYDSDLKSYIQGIWSTWAELPSTSRYNIPDYVMRSLCVIVLNQIEQPLIEENAINIFREIIQKLEIRNPAGAKHGLLKEALEYIDPEKNNEEHFSNIENKLSRRRFLIQCVKTFFYSHSIKTNIDHENWPISKNKQQEIKRLEIPQLPFSNPLKLTELSADSKSFSEAKSYLIYYNLAFNYVRD